MTVARASHKQSDDILVPIAEGNDLVALYVLMSAEPEMIAPLLRRRRASITMNDADVEVIILVKQHH
ncbi:MAG: hypothetical protein AAGE59_17540 [Cyanobacteria bacterium P01_F01_bin.86]